MLFLSFNGFAQSKQVGAVKRVTASQLMIYNGLMDFTPPEVSKMTRSTNAIIRFGGFRYIPNYYFFRSGVNINHYANTFIGVVSINGATPSIKGAKSDGTAYFVDGVRVYAFSESPAELMATAVKLAWGF